MFLKTCPIFFIFILATDPTTSSPIPVKTPETPPKRCPLTEFNSPNCLECYCSGASTDCKSHQGYYFTIPVRTSKIKTSNLLTIFESNWNELLPTDSEHQYRKPQDSQISATETSLEFIDLGRRFSAESHYVKIPLEYELTFGAYNGELSYIVNYDLSSHHVSELTNYADVILDNGEEKLAYRSSHSFSSGSDNIVKLKLKESNFQKTDLSMMSRKDFLEYLPTIKYVYIRLIYNQAMNHLFIRNIEIQDAFLDLESGIESDEKAVQVESCSCPAGYTGFSCESCDKNQGYTKNMKGDCIPPTTTAPLTTTTESTTVEIEYKPCHAPGTINNVFETPETEDCPCKHSFTGQKCENCKPGFFGNNCQKCKCNGYDCNSKTGDCDKCPSSLLGPGCTAQCKNNHFRVSSPEGTHNCINCYCSGVAETCSAHNSLYRYRESIRFDGSDVKQTFGITINDGKLLGKVASTRIGPQLVVKISENFQKPGQLLYWTVKSDQLTGNQLSTYGGKLSFKHVYTPGKNSRPLENRPSSIIMVGENGMSLEARLSRPPTPRRCTTGKIPMKQGYWRIEEKAATRNQILDVLKNVKSYSILAGYKQTTDYAALSHVTIEPAVEKSGSGKKTVEVERCECPVEYAGNSCEDCSVGYERDLESGKCRLPEKSRCNEKPLEIVFLVDGSDSVHEKDFPLIPGWISSMVQSFDPESRSHPTTTVVVQFSTNIKEEFVLSVKNNVEELEKKLDAITQLANGTNTYSALNFVSSKVSHKLKSDSLKTLVLITDGASRDRNKNGRSGAVLESVRQDFDFIVAVGIGERVDDDELFDITRNRESVLHVDDVQGLNDVTEKIKEDICYEVEKLMQKEDQKKKDDKKEKDQMPSFEPEIQIEGDSEIYVQIEGPRRLTVPLNAEINIICNAYVNLKVSF